MIGCSAVEIVKMYDCNTATLLQRVDPLSQKKISDLRKLGRTHLCATLTPPTNINREVSELFNLWLQLNAADRTILLDLIRRFHSPK